MVEPIVSTMKQLGFTATEAKAYIGLLKSNPATGYEVAAAMGIPRSAIYGVLAKLESLGVINAVQDKPTKYVPMPPSRLMDHLGTRFTGLLDRLKSALDSLEVPAEPLANWTLRGYESLLDQARALIRQSEKSVVASIWQREAKALTNEIVDAFGRELDVVLFSFTPLPDLPGDVFSYDIPESELERYWPHRLILVVDQKRALIGSAERAESNRSVLTEEDSLIEMALSNLVLDITLFGQRNDSDTAHVMTRLTRHLAPVDELLAKRSQD